MAKPTNRATFKEYCLRKLGKPVIEINVSEEQVDDRVDEAVAYWNDYHFDGTEQIWLKHQITATDITNGYITVPETIIGVADIFNVGSSISSNSIFNVKYQFSLNNIHDLSNFGLTSYYMAMQHIAFLEEILVGKVPIRYNRHVNKLYLDMDWGKVNEGQYIIAKVYGVLDEDVSDMWKDRWLQNYATAKIKYQWGSNLTKFEGMQLPGGVQFNGTQILQDALAEIQSLEEDMINSYSLPVSDLIG